MAFIPAANVAHVAFVGELDGQENVNDLFFISTAPPITALSLQALADALSTWYGDFSLPLHTEGYFYSHARARDLTAQFSFVAVSTNSAGAGSSSAEPTPSNVAANIVFGTGLAGRSLHGSNRIPDLIGTNVNGNDIDPTYLSSFLDMYDALLAPTTVLPGGWTWGMVSFFSGSFIDLAGKKKPLPRAAGIFHEIFDVYFPDTTVDSQKTRLPGHGR